MSGLGKGLLIFGIIALIGAILFGVSVAAFGVTDNNYGITIGGVNILNAGGIQMGGMFGTAGVHFSDGTTVINEEYESFREYTYEMDASALSGAKIALASCKADVSCTDTDKISIKYKTGNMKTEFTAKLTDNTLYIEEKTASWLNFGSTTSSELTLTIPKKMYAFVNFDLASGRIAGSDITAESIMSDTASGTLDLSAYAKKMNIQLASGKVILKNCTEEAADSIKIEAASGSVNMTGFRSGSTDVQLASGTAELSGISGRVSAQLASGHVNLNYAEWNSDLDIDLASGKVDVTLPAGSGANISFKRASGSMNVDLDGMTASLKGSSDTTVGGSNTHHVDAETLSGSISIHN